MDLILWRHAEAEDGFEDDKRKLTPKGRKQAAKMAQWLDAHLPRHCHVIASPAVRTRETAAALAEKFVTSDQIGLSATPDSVLRAAGWPRAAQPVVIVGHQPTLGMTAARLLAGSEAQWSLRKGAFIWIVRKGSENVLRAALSPDLI
ncbi:MAG: histidine phosphatase family protein [Betaproteobacteria bacterium]|nr:MAG: histidine phosphatase family protein [Betaproteobacteria bacterium]